MSRTYVLQSPGIAIASARMKADVNYIGIADQVLVSKLAHNHVFLCEAWEQGPITERRLQRLYHRLMPGDSLFMEANLPEPLLIKALRYAKEAGATTVLVYMRPDLNKYSIVSSQADILIVPESNENMAANRVITFREHEHAEALAGAFALALMNGLDEKQAEAFYRKAALSKELPWYDEVAYG